MGRQGALLRLPVLPPAQWWPRLRVVVQRIHLLRRQDRRLLRGLRRVPEPGRGHALRALVQLLHVLGARWLLLGLRLVRRLPGDLYAVCHPALHQLNAAPLLIFACWRCFQGVASALKRVVLSRELCREEGGMPSVSALPLGGGRGRRVSAGLRSGCVRGRPWCVCVCVGCVLLSVQP